MFDSWRRAGLALLFGVLGTHVALAGGVRIVSPTGGQNFTDIQTAVDAAAEGDVLLVAAGSYNEFTIDGKSLSIFAVPGADVQVSARVIVENLGAKQRVLLSGLRISGLVSTVFVRDTLILIHDNQGYVRLQDCDFLGGFSGWGYFTCDPWHGGYGAKVLDSDRVAFLDCRLRGSEGQWQDAINGDCDGGDGGTALRATRSRVAMHGCELTGGRGGKAKGYAGPGGEGLEAIDSEVYASGGFVLGGNGGSAYGPGTLAKGGAGIWLDATSVLDAVDWTATGGAGQPPGPTVSGSGSYNPLPTLARSLAVDTIVPAGTPTGAGYAGEAGDVVWLAATATPGHLWQTGSWGVWLTKYPAFVPFTPLGIAASSGLATFALPVGPTAPGASHRQIVFQGLVFARWGQRLLSGARHVLALSPTVGPDCNGNGTSDYLDVILGTSPDTNQNLVPDECDP